VVLTAGQDHDSPQFIPVLEAIRIPRRRGGLPRSRPYAVAGDKAYGSRGNRAHLRNKRIKAVIPEKADQKAARAKKGAKGGWPPAFDAQAYKRRNLVERCNNRLKQWRGIATRFDKLPERYQGGIELASALIWLRSLRPE
jgi:transposase